MLVVPVAAAAQVAQSFKQSILLAILAAEFAAIAGVTLSYVYGLAAGGSIVVAAIGVYAVALSSRKLISRLPSVRRLGSQRPEHTREGLEADGGKRE
jgi:zinc transport system permease protein